MKLSLAVSGYPPDFDGIGDYTYNMARALGEKDCVELPVTVYTRTGNYRKVDGVNVIDFFNPSYSGSFSNLYRCLREKPTDWLVLQYNPFGWGRRGFCPSVPRTLQHIRRLPKPPRIAVMFHELFTEDSGWKNRIMKIWQMALTERVAKCADLRLTSCQAYADWLVNSGYTATCLPVSSNLPTGMAKRSANLAGFLFGSFGSPHASRRMDLVAKSVATVRSQGIDASFVFVGSGGERARDEFERLGVPFRSTGAIGAKEAADEIATLDVFLAPFSDGLSGRRTSAIAALKAGVPLVSSAGKRTDLFLSQAHGKALFLAETDEDFIRQVGILAHDSELRAKIGGAGKHFYDETLSVDVISSSLVGLLEGHNEN